MNETCVPQVIETESAIATVRKQAVIVQSHVWKKMHGWCKAATSEVSGLGLVRLTDRGMEVYDVFLPKQKCSSGYTELDELATPRLITKLHKTKRRTQDLRFWWHTHYNFGTFWSSTDDNNAREMVETNGDWLLSIVINQKGDYRCRVDTVKPIRTVIDKLTVYIGKDDKKAYARKRNYKTDIKRYVSPMTYAGPNESGFVSYVGGQQYGTTRSYGSEYEGYADELGEYGNYGRDGYDPYNDKKKDVETSHVTKPLWDWWRRYEKNMKDRGIVVKKPSWVKDKEEEEKKTKEYPDTDKAITTLAKRLSETASRNKYSMEDGEEINLDGQAYIYHGGMFLSEDQYLWSLESGRVPDNEADKQDCDDWIKENKSPGLIS